MKHRGINVFLLFPQSAPVLRSRPHKFGRQLRPPRSVFYNPAKTCGSQSPMPHTYSASAVLCASVAESLTASRSPQDTSCLAHGLSCLTTTRAHRKSLRAVLMAYALMLRINPCACRKPLTCLAPGANLRSILEPIGFSDSPTVRAFYQ